MKYIQILIVAVSCLFLNISCEKETMLIFSEDILNLYFPEQGGSQQIVFSCNKEWSVAVSDSWLHVTPSSGSSSEKDIILNITCDSNLTYDARNATIIVSSDHLSETISVYQDAKIGLLVSPDKIYLTNEAQTIDVEVSSNVEYSIVIDNACKEWISQVNTKGLSANVEVFNIAANSTYDNREGTIHFIQGDGTATDVIITQQQLDAFFLLSSDNNSLSYKDQTFEIKALTNIPVDVIIDSDWITYEETRALNETSIFLKINENKTFEKRSSKVVLKHNLLEYVIDFTQYGQPIDLSYEGTANSYIVPLTDAYFSIDASIAGNDKSHLLVGGTKASIVWESLDYYMQENLIDDLEYDSESGRIIFLTSQSEGNVLIALHDENDTIIWSWHLWLTDYNPNENYITLNNGEILMDRYLGAKTEETGGLYYQWGRKDPFAPGKYNSTIINENTGTVEYSISHPDTYLKYYYDDTNWDWNYEHSAKWSSTKTIYDPCPPGWKVMDSSCFSSLPNWSSVERNENCFIIGEPICTPAAKFGYTGLLHSAGHIQGESSALLWTNRGSYHSFYVAFEISMGDNGFYSGFGGRAYGQCVRCQREQ